MKRSILFIIILFPSVLLAQQEKKWGINFSGYVKNDVIFDTRQNITIREGHFALYPANEFLDKNNKDVYAKSSLNIFAIQSRLSGNISGPDAFGAKTMGLIEGEFFGASDATINTFRLRHAYMKLNWTKTELILGQTWHPLFLVNCFPDVIAFNTGSPFIPNARNPQIKLTQNFGFLKLVVAAAAQRDFTSPGGSISLRNSAIPDLNLQLHYSLTDVEKGTDILAGLGCEFKSLLPRLITDSLYKTDERVNSVAYSGFFKYQNSKFTIKSQGTIGQNMYDLTMLGGFAKKYSTDSLRLAQDNFEYTTLNCYAIWLDMQTGGKVINGGLFLGYTKSLGSVDYFIGKDYIRGINIDYVYRISSRINYYSGKMRFCGEIEYTTAAYGTADIQGLIKNSKEISNIRFQFGAYYYF